MYQSSIKTRFIIITLLFSFYLVPKEASADLLGFWLKPKTEYINGTNEVFDFTNGLGGGVEVGVEVLNISIWADYMFIGAGQYWASGNLGFDLEFGDDLQFLVGAYAGGFVMGLGEALAESGLTDAQRSELSMVPGFDIDSFEQGYNEATANESQLLDKAGGITGRLRLSLSYKLTPLLYAGIQGTFGYHYVLSGLEASSEAKSSYIDKIAAEEGLPDGTADQLKEALDLNETKAMDPSGFNYSAGVFINLKF